MLKKLLVALAIVGLFASFTVGTANAADILSVGTFKVDCGGMYVEGTADSAYAGIDIFVYDENFLFVEYVNRVFPVTNGEFVAAFQFPTYPDGTIFEAYAYPSDANGSYLGGAFFLFYDLCPYGDGPGVPDGYVLRRVSCTAPLYQEDGIPVDGGLTLNEGQTWFFSPELYQDGYYDVFVSNYDISLFPAACVGEQVQ
jgi:hypothetical protein